VVGVCLLWAEFTHGSGVSNVVSLIQQDVVVADRFKSIGAIDLLFGGVGRVGANALAEASKFVCV